MLLQKEKMLVINAIKNIEIKPITVILGIMLCFISCNGQNKYHSEFKIGAIPNYAKFEKMTAREIELDSMKNKHSIESLKQMIDGTAFREGVSEADKQETIAYHKIMSQRYKDNRSRYFMQLNVNGTKDPEYFKGIDTLTTECSCYLDGDTIRVKMGLWVFGGFFFSIDVTKNKFKSTYLKDSHKQAIYKSNLSDTSLEDNVLVENEAQSLILEKKPAFLIDENILGYLAFKTKNYYRTKEYESNTGKDRYNDGIMDTLNMAGSLYFKCKVREKTRADE